LHWPTIDAPGRPISKTLRRRFHADVASCVVPGETVDCDVIFLYHPSILTNTPDPLPEIASQMCLLIADKGPRTMPQGMWRDPHYNIDEANQVVKSIFGFEPNIARAFFALRASVRLAATYPPLTKRNWTLLVNSVPQSLDSKLWNARRLPAHYRSLLQDIVLSVLRPLRRQGERAASQRSIGFDDR
jgi:hypothetical protein